MSGFLSTELKKLGTALHINALANLGGTASDSVAADSLASVSAVANTSGAKVAAPTTSSSNMPLIISGALAAALAVWFFFFKKGGSRGGRKVKFK
jgi:LPXTG-motif cell wall-anchored protein